MFTKEIQTEFDPREVGRHPEIVDKNVQGYHRSEAEKVLGADIVLLCVAQSTDPISDKLLVRSTWQVKGPTP